MTAPRNKTDFDRYAGEYDELVDRSIRSSGFPASFFTERKIREIAETLGARVAEQQLRILNFGCGIGKSEPFLVRAFPRAEITSLDISPASIARAQEINSSLRQVQFSVFDGSRVPFPAGFDVVLLAGVLHHIAPEDRPKVVQELHRVLADNGSLFIFEHNPWNPLTRKAVQDCPFDEDAELVPVRDLRGLLRKAGFGEQQIRFIHFFPRILRIFIPLERWMRSIPLGAQYYCVARKRTRTS